LGEHVAEHRQALLVDLTGALREEIERVQRAVEAEIAGQEATN
jgi:hypothetical protein